MTLMVFLFIFRSVVPFVKSFFVKTFSSDEVLSPTRFCDANGVYCYTPDITHKLFEYPFLACDLTYVKDKHISWEDPLQHYAYYDLTKDADHIRTVVNKERGDLNIADDKLLFAPIKSWIEEE